MFTLVENILHLDIPIGNSFIRFGLHQRNNPDNSNLKRKAGYSFCDFREKVIHGLCGSPGNGNPPTSIAASPLVVILFSCICSKPILEDVFFLHSGTFLLRFCLITLNNFNVHFILESS